MQKRSQQKRTSQAKRATTKPAERTKIASTDLIAGDDEIADLDLELPMTREQAMRIVRRTPLICRGPLSAEGRQARDAAARAGDAEAFKNADAAGRPGCGFNYVELLEEAPLDGSEIEYTCPNCGVEGTIRTPRFNLTD